MEASEARVAREVKVVVVVSSSKNVPVCVPCLLPNVIPVRTVKVGIVVRVIPVRTVPALVFRAPVAVILDKNSVVMKIITLSRVVVVMAAREEKVARVARVATTVASASEDTTEDRGSMMTDRVDSIMMMPSVRALVVTTEDMVARAAKE